MNKVRLLPEQVANQIAAGEVVERPASVLKELIENALDAGARQIDIRTSGGGTQLIQVTDDGSGMSRDDALLALERHATSKLETAADLSKVLSYGFRGEALPSMASVSRFRLRTRLGEALEGTEIVVEGGKIKDVRDTGMAPGTTIELRQLFFNVPARKKFLKTEATETAHLKTAVLNAALARPDVGFAVKHGEGPNASNLRLPPDQTLQARVRALLGPETSGLLLPVEAEDGRFALRGCLSQPGISRSSRAEQHVFINGRAVVNRAVQFALAEGYAGALPKGRHPVAVLFLEMDPAEVDVNIHPAKREVRFRDEYRLRAFLVHAISAALRQEAKAPAPALDTARKPAPVEGVAPEDSVPEDSAPEPSPFQTPWEEKQERGLTSVPAEAESPVETPAPKSSPSPRRQAPPAPTMPVIPSEMKGWLEGAPTRQEDLTGLETEVARDNASASEPREKTLAEEFRLLGEMGGAYLLVEGDEGLVLLDVRAAHERVLFERLLHSLATEGAAPPSQRLLMPATVTLPLAEAVALEPQLNTLNRLGVGLSAFGAETYLVDSLPADCPAGDPAAFVRQLAGDFAEAGAATKRGRRLEEDAIVGAVCREAVRTRDRLSPQEQVRLLDDLLACELPYTCPSGRPTMIQYSFHELERKFQRKR